MLNCAVLKDGLRSDVWAECAMVASRLRRNFLFTKEKFAIISTQ
jgi:hypothetical protein